MIQIIRKSNGAREIASNLYSWNWKIQIFVRFLFFCTALALSSNIQHFWMQTDIPTTPYDREWGFCPYIHFGIRRFPTLCIKISNPLSKFARIHAFVYILLIRISLQCDKWEEGWELMTNLEWNSLTKIENTLMELTILQESMHNTHTRLCQITFIIMNSDSSFFLVIVVSSQVKYNIRNVK